MTKLAKNDMSTFKGHGLVHFTGCFMGNPTPKDLTTWLLAQHQPPRIKWQPLPGLKLQAYVDDIRPENRPGRGLREEDMDPVQAWCEECGCGVRMSFNVWLFKNEKQITMFLIRWSS